MTGERSNEEIRADLAFLHEGMAFDVDVQRLLRDIEPLLDALGAVRVERDAQKERADWNAKAVNENAAMIDRLRDENRRLSQAQTAIEAVCAEVEADDERHLNTFGQHLPGSVVRVAEMIRAAIAAAVGAVPETPEKPE